MTFFTVLAIVVMTAVVLLKGKRPVVRSSDGAAIRLDRYVFAARPVRYDLWPRAAVHDLANMIPQRMRSWLRFDSRQTTLVRPEFPNESFLSAAFYVVDSMGYLVEAGSRVVISDDLGQTFDPAANQASGGVYEIPVFPRRGSTLHLRLMDGDKFLAEFRIPNPVRPPHPVWQPKPIPQKAISEELEVTLESFSTDVIQNITVCTIRVEWHGRRADGWNPEAFEISDATGNHWKARVKNIDIGRESGLINATLLGNLWPGENAWKVRVHFKDSESRERAVEFLASPRQQ
jgi:hypothetical protein